MSEKKRHDDPEAFERSREVGHEIRDANVRATYLFGLGLVTLIAVALALMYVLALFLAGPDLERPPIAASGDVPVIFDRDVQANQELLRRAEERTSQQVLASYSWVDRSGGIARIPIRRAMELLVAHQEAGWKWWDQTSSEGESAAAISPAEGNSAEVPSGGRQARGEGTR